MGRDNSLFLWGNETEKGNEQKSVGIKDKYQTNVFCHFDRKQYCLLFTVIVVCSLLEVPPQSLLLS